MSVPTEADFMVVKIATGPSTFAVICGIENVAINKAVSGTDRYRRDCAFPGRLGTRKNILSGKSLTITASGAIHIPNIDVYEGALGVPMQYQIELRQYDGSDAGLGLGAYTGEFVLMSENITSDPNANSTAEVTLNNNGPWIWDVVGEE